MKVYEISIRAELPEEEGLQEDDGGPDEQDVIKSYENRTGSEVSSCHWDDIVVVQEVLSCRLCKSNFSICTQLILPFSPVDACIKGHAQRGYVA